LDWAEQKGELPSTMVQNWRNASTKVLEIEGDDWRDMNVITLDLDAHLDRFTVLKRTSYTEGSMSAYKSRTKTAIEAYRKWQANPGSSEWKPKAGSPRTGKAGSEPKAPKSTTVPSVQTSVTSVGQITGTAAVTFIDYPFPLRPGVQVRIALPDDLTGKEAARVARFVESLAITEQLQITSGNNG
jgi:hypothetical protein